VISQPQTWFGLSAVWLGGGAGARKALAPPRWCWASAARSTR